MVQWMILPSSFPWSGSLSLLMYDTDLSLQQFLLNMEMTGVSFNLKMIKSR